VFSKSRQLLSRVVSLAGNNSGLCLLSDFSFRDVSHLWFILYSGPHTITKAAAKLDQRQE
jgi:hypothetical protein